MSDVFLLGAERCGSTWVANILDAHPDVELWMEPFADYAGLFPAVPGRNVWLGEATPELEAAIREGFAALPGLKYPLFHRRGGSPRLQRAEQALLRTVQRWLRQGLHLNPRALARYELLQLNAIETPVGRLTRKRPAPLVEVTKELRLNFKAGLLRDCFPRARFVVVLRHPGAQVASILSWMGRGRLGELARALEAFGARLRGQDRLAPFERALTDLPAARTLEGTLVAWWGVSYSVLLGDLGARGAYHRVLRHERLCDATSDEVAALLAFVGLPADPAVDRYVDWSSATNPKGGSPTETVRHSAESSRAAIRSVSEPVREACATVLLRLRDAGLLHAELDASIEG